MNQPVQLIITMHGDRRIEVSGPIQDKIACYGLLEAAKDAIKDFHDKQAASAIVPATPGDMLAVKRGH